MIDPKYTKPVTSLLTLQTEENTLKVVSDNDLKYSLCDRSDITDNKGHYFVSFNLPHSASEFGTGCTMSKYFPELQQLNVEQIIIAPIPSNKYSEFIDGRSITFSVPQIKAGGTQTTMSAITLYSSTYSSDKILKSESNPLLGDNVVFLFCDEINRPYTGSSFNDIGELVSNAANTSWNPTSNFLDRPSAVSYAEVKDGNLSLTGPVTKAWGTDLRAASSVKYAVRVNANYPDDRIGYNYDIPVGFAVLDKGFLVITHTGITSNFPWQSGYTATNAAYIEDGDVSSKKDIYFTGTTSFNGDEASLLSFYDINTSFKTTAVCLAMPREFYISNNPTWNREKALSELNEQTGVINFDPVYVTEIGLFNAIGELIAVGKLSEPISKTYTNVLTFNLDIEM